MALGLVNEAVPLGEKALGLTRKVFGPERPETLSAMNTLAASYSNAGRLEEALTMHEEVLASCRKVLGPEHPDTLTSMSSRSST